MSNFSQKKLESFLPFVEITPAVDQLELHPYNPDHGLIAYLRSKNILPEAYSALGSTNSPIITDETVVEIARKDNLTPADVLLGWLRM